MKKLLLTLTVVAATALTTYAQGRVGFNNSISGVLIGITPVPAAAAPGQGAPGAHVGSNYSIQLLWASGTYASTAAFLLAPDLGTGAPTTFFGTTGNDGSGAGFFDGGTVAMNGAAGTYTMMARAWFNTGFATFAAAANGGANTGSSSLFQMNVTAPPTGIVNTAVPAFVVGVVPEPSTFALAGLGAAALLLFRRRK